MSLFDGLANLFSTTMTNQQNLELTREAWQREDTAVQRRVADLRAAGINPILAAGQAATSMAPARMEATRFSGLGNDDVELYKQAVTAKDQIAIQKANAAIAKFDSTDALHYRDEIMGNQAFISAQEAQKSVYDRNIALQNQIIAENNAAFYTKWGLPSNATSQARFGAELAEVLSRSPKVITDMKSTFKGAVQDLFKIGGD